MSPNEPFVPFSRPDISPADVARVVAVLESGWLTTGPEVRAFEQGFERLLGGGHAIAVSSATAGLQLALRGVGVGPGDLVLTSSYTFTATGDAVHACGASLVFADIDPATLDLDPRAVRERLARLATEAPEQRARLKALVPVHVGGLACDLDALGAIAREHGLTLVDDAAHALPCSFGGVPIGRHGHPAVFSFYATKPVTTGEGGMIVTDDADLAARLRRLRLHGIDRDPWARGGDNPAPEGDYEVVEEGLKANLSDVAAALGVSQLERCAAMHARREAVARAYRDAFAGDPRLELPAGPRQGDVHAWHLFPVFVPAEARDPLRESLRRRGVATSLHYRPLHLHRAYRERYHLAPEALPQALARSRQAVSLPIYSTLSDAQVAHVIAAMQAALDESGRR